MTAPPPPRSQHTAGRTGAEMIVGSGTNNVVSLSDTWSYTPSRVMFLYPRP